MAAYYVNNNAQANGDHEVHKDGCSYMPQGYKRQHRGEFSLCRPAVAEAKKHHAQSNGCYYCALDCHTN
jgi:hypothetical protein